MANPRINSACNRIVHDPSRMIDSSLDGVPESWRQTLQLTRPIDGLNICCMHGRPGANWTFQAEGEPNLTMGLLLEGRMEAGIEDGAEFRLEPGQAVLLATGQHVCGWDVLSAQRDFHLLNINLTQDALRGLTGMQIQDVLKMLRESRCDMAHVDVCMASMPLFSNLQRLAGEICRCARPDYQARHIFLCAKVIECLAVMLERYTLMRGAPSIQRATSGDRPRLLRAHALLENRYGDAWSVQSLAQAAGLNEKRLQAGFQALYGCTVHECLTRIRLDMAQGMLASGHSVTDTAQAVGFANVSHFSKVFCSHVGVSPRRWMYRQLADD